ncbi:bifunctional 2-keto-4-hydroxyglutarate aldolase/2-keto-3-deoxy-6-phosphogluconate aldolase [Paenibacillus hunanensis]|uniref:2-dehydro-3-deoxyphosphogluconate aldolase/(4S)-4-hydroxy-2-oxoglutarate aldolase n=1 Tax=Paenibacillus hunanensis TaxID=539262 RepID=A0ABU1J3N8_9BACL|nr:bifunctional 2-keto-4-hydroxyglutarate aldolase/2-keto-3-deoxy-6-phosphogluconate aldolase [Paenibacillus hunanensis]MDR6245187.1 2-dehydro-3-deoxyphosphogluconate aldolase/(4S)-4-hydroxy-2-oxoglutarate aldolase [Paenibacillus hunanensis]GGJ20814.1 bifunctional 2-keto-4-hydroxyglutarate aldolase/2-keto-3-deoxy-6-phosphogluconate aldolase [Paenibacillus hunanensis]
MWRKLDNLNRIAETGIVLIIRLDSEEEALAVADAAVEGGIKALEITMSVPNALGIIRTLSNKYKNDDVLVGAGTILDAETARAAILAGAEMLVSPQLNPDMIRVANRYQAVTISGAYTPTEIFDTLQAGADIVKLFPAETLGPQFVKTVTAPLPQAPIVPTGGVTPQNVQEWLQAGCIGVGVGSYITKAAQQDGDYSRVTAAAREFLAAVAAAR